jgi:hypothetical protein
VRDEEAPSVATWCCGRGLLRQAVPGESEKPPVTVASGPRLDPLHEPGARLLGWQSDGDAVAVVYPEVNPNWEIGAILGVMVAAIYPTHLRRRRRARSNSSRQPRPSLEFQSLDEVHRQTERGPG